MEYQSIGCAVALAIVFGTMFVLFVPQLVYRAWAHLTDPDRQAKGALAAATREFLAREGFGDVAKVSVLSPGSVNVTVAAPYETRRSLRRKLEPFCAERGVSFSIRVAEDYREMPETTAVDPSWEALEHAYGTASDVPAWLDLITPDPKEEAWGELWSRLCHQGSVYSASFAALPILLEKAEEWSPAERASALILAGAIFNGRDQSFERQQLAAGHASRVAEFLRLTEESLATRGIDPIEYLYLLQAFAAFAALPGWSGTLDRLATGELEVSCPHCSAVNLVAISDKYGFFSATEDYVGRPDVPTRPLIPGNAAELPPPGDRFVRWADEAGQVDVVRWLTYAFGEADCAACGVRFSVPAAIESSEG